MNPSQFILQNKKHVVADLNRMLFTTNIRSDVSDIVTPFGFAFTNDTDLLRFLKKCKKTEDLENYELFKKYHLAKETGFFFVIILTPDNELMEVTFNIGEFVGFEGVGIRLRFTEIPRHSTWSAIAKPEPGWDRLTKLSETRAICDALNLLADPDDTFDDVMIKAEKVFYSPMRSFTIFDEATIEKHREAFSLELHYFPHPSPKPGENHDDKTNSQSQDPSPAGGA